MKILQVVNFFKPSWESGGPARVTYELAKKLIERGHEVTVYTTDGFRSRLDVKKNKPVDVDGINTYYFRNLSSYLAGEVKLPTPYYLPIVARKKIKEFDVIHIHEHKTILAIIVHHYAKKYRVPYVLQAHGSVLPFFQKQLLKKLFDQVWGYRILKDASKVIALTTTEAEQYKSMGVSEEKIEIIPNGIDLSEFENLPERGDFRKKWGIDDNQIILYLGRIDQTKRIDLLAKAFAELSKEMDNVKLVIAGPDNGYLPALKKLMKELRIEERVLFTGMLYHDQKIKAYIDADVFVTPSFYGFPLTFLEACACGVPIITTNKGDNLDWIHDNVGYVVDYNKKHLSNAILHMLNDDKMRQQFGEKGRLLVRERFNWEKIAGRVENIYNQITLNNRKQK